MWRMSESAKHADEQSLGSSKSSSDGAQGSSTAVLPTELPIVPSLFTNRPILQDSLATDTLLDQQDTVDDILPYLADIDGEDVEFNSHGLPKLQRQPHIKFLSQTLERLSGVYIGFDSSRPWIVYWALTGLCLLGQDVTRYRER